MSHHFDPQNIYFRLDDGNAKTSFYMRMDGETYVGEYEGIEHPMGNPPDPRSLYVTTVVVWQKGEEASNLDLTEYLQFISVTENRENILKLFNRI